MNYRVPIIEITAGHAIVEADSPDQAAERVLSGSSEHVGAIDTWETLALVPTSPAEPN